MSSQLVQRWQVEHRHATARPPPARPAWPNGRVYVGSSAASPANNFFAFDAVTGAPAWAVTVGYRSSCFNVGIGSTAAISGTTLVVGAAAPANPAYYGLDDQRLGRPLWRNPMNVGASALPLGVAAARLWPRLPGHGLALR